MTTVYVEGGGSRRGLRAKCREAFHSYFGKTTLGDRVPRVVAAGGRGTAYNRFRSALSPQGATCLPGGPYVLLHTLAHLLIQSLAMRCGYPASSLRERIYAESGRYGILVYTGTRDAEGTLGGLVQQGRHIEDHLAEALRMGQLCSNDPICAQHAPAESMRNAYLHGAACHGCTLIAETSCEMRNDFLDRALVVPVLGLDDAAFFPGPL